MAAKTTARQTAKKASTTKTSSRKSSAKKTSAKSAAKKSTAKKSTARKSGAKSFKPGDKVAWDTSQGTTYGKVVKKQTTPTKIKTHTVAASKNNPEYIVESEKSGKRAAHKPQELRKRS